MLIAASTNLAHQAPTTFQKTFIAEIQQLALSHFFINTKIPESCSKLLYKLTEQALRPEMYQLNEP